MTRALSTDDSQVPSGRFHTVTEIAEWAHVSERTVLREIANGHLPARRFGAQWRIDDDGLDAWGRVA